MSEKKDDDIKETAQIYRDMVDKGMVEEGFVKDLLSGNFTDFNELLSRKYPKKENDK
ncbi:hypothetical protein [Mesobacillus maritimus]|uniref:hypothetical protein n=1 Tax=Mesobacillus maritimus TaxID=1643336 RepID=UPI00384F693E